jgi:hypothetical protein
VVEVHEVALADGHLASEIMFSPRWLPVLIEAKRTELAMQVYRQIRQTGGEVSFNRKTVSNLIKMAVAVEKWPDVRQLYLDMQVHIQYIFNISSI